MTKIAVLSTFLIAELALIAIAFSLTSYAVYGISARVGYYNEYYDDYDDYYGILATFVVKLRGDLGLYSLLLVGYLLRLIVTPIYLTKEKGASHANFKLKLLKNFQMFLRIVFGWIFVFGLAANILYGVLAGGNLLGIVAAGLAMWVLSIVSSIAGLILCRQVLKDLEHQETDQANEEEDDVRKTQAQVSPQQYVNQLQMHSPPEMAHQYAQFTQPANPQFGMPSQPSVYQEQPQRDSNQSNAANSWTIYTGK